jgi:hypothetical protein
MPTLGLFSDTRLTRVKCTIILTLYVLVALAGVVHHELGLDEAHQFTLGLWSSSLPQLFDNARYEGHPVSWYVLIWLVTRFAINPLGVQILNVVLCSAAVWIFLRYAPFNLLFKLFFISGYIMIYEYSVISRNYALTTLCLFTISWFYQYRKDHRILFALLLALLANTHLFGAIVSAALLGQMLIEYFFSQPHGNGREILLASIIILSGISVALWQIIPPAHYLHFLFGSNPSLYLNQARKVYATPFRGLFNLPDLTTYYCWNTNLFTDRYWNVCRILLPLPALVALVLLARKPFTIVFLILSVTGIMLVEYFALNTDSRHSGFIYVVFIAALWMGYYEADSVGINKMAWLNTFIKVALKPAMLLLWLALLLQVTGGGILYAKDFCEPFSESKETCQYLTGRSLQNAFIVTNNQNLGPAVSAYLHRSVYNIQADREGTFCDWNVAPQPLSYSTIIANTERHLTKHDTVVLLLDRYLKGEVNATAHIELLKAFDKAFLRSENYWVYLVVRKP